MSADVTNNVAVDTQIPTEATFKGPARVDGKLLTYDIQDHLSLEDFVGELERTNTHVVVVVPIHNDHQSITNTVNEWRPLMHNLGSHRAPVTQIFVIDDRSTDGSGEAARAAGAIVLYPEAAARIYPETLSNDCVGSRKGGLLKIGATLAGDFMRHVHDVDSDHVVVVFADGNLNKHVVEATGSDWVTKDSDGRSIPGPKYPHIIGTASPIVASIDTATRVKWSQGFTQKREREENGVIVTGGRTDTAFVKPIFEDPRFEDLHALHCAGLEGRTIGEYAVLLSEYEKMFLAETYAIEVSQLGEVVRLAKVEIAAENELNEERGLAPTTREATHAVAQVRHPTRSKAQPRQDHASPNAADNVRGDVNTQGQEIRLAAERRAMVMGLRDEVPFERPDGTLEMKPVFWEIEGGEPVAYPINHRVLDPINAMSREERDGRFFEALDYAVSWDDRSAQAMKLAHLQLARKEASERASQTEGASKATGEIANLENKTAVLSEDPD